MKVFFLNFLLCITLWGDWNRDFDHKTALMIQEMPQFQTDSYIEQFRFFKSIRNQLVGEQNFRAILKPMSFTDDHLIPLAEKGVIVKKRRNDITSEYIVYELSILLGSDKYFVASFPFRILGKTAIMQNYHSFSVGLKLNGHPKSLVKKVSLIDYWKAHIQAYLFGLEDFIFQNIGLTDEGDILLFDTESVFRYRPNGFASMAFEWPHYRKPLTKRQAQKLRDFIHSFSNFEEDFSHYLKYRDFTMPDEFFTRLDKIRSVSIKKGTSFRGVFGKLYPQKNEGLDKLNKIVESIMHVPCDHGKSLFFVKRWMGDYPMTDKQKQSLKKWLAKYMPHVKAPQ